MFIESVRADLAALRRMLTLLHTPWRRVALAVAFGVLALGAAIGLAAVSAWLIARASQRPLILDLTVAVVAVRALGISRGVFRYFDRLFSHDVALRGVAQLREETYRRLANAPTQVTIGLRRGDLLARFGADVDAIGDFVVRALMPLLSALIAGAGSVALISLFSPRSALVLGVMLLLTGTLSPVAAALAAWRSEQATVHARARVAAATMSVVDTADELRVSRRMDSTLAELAGAEGDLRTALRRASWPAAIAPALNTVAMGVAVVAALLIGGRDVAAGNLTPVLLAVIVLTPLAVFEAVDALPAAAVQTLHSAAAARRLEEVLTDSASAVAGGDVADLSAAPMIRAENLTIGYPGAEPVLSGLNFELPPGKTLAIVGASGVGKTTLLATLAGLLPPLGGTVELRGQATGILADGEAAKTAVFTAEDAHIFDTTILENLRVARGDLAEEEAARALADAGLADFLAGLPDGVHTRLGENATMVSGGERRRLLLARALCSPAPFMLLDEPGEHLDNETADALTAHMLSLAHPATPAGAAKRGVIVVTHRPQSVAGADDVVRLG